MYHSITIGEKNTFSDWHLISPSRPLVLPPPPKTNYVDILGMNGSLDYTEALTKFPRYSDRQGSWEFVVLNPGDVETSLYPEPFESYNWSELYSEILSYLHGKYFDHIVLEDDPLYTYRGRVWVNEWRSDAGWSRIVLNYRLQPFKYSLREKNSKSVLVPIDYDPSDTAYNARYIYLADNQNRTITVPAGLSPSQLFVRASSSWPHSDPYETSAIVSCRGRFINPELGIDHFFTMFSPPTHNKIRDIMDADEENDRKCRDYYYYDRDKAIKMCFVSNLSGNNACGISFGAYSANDTMYGPATLEYWWEEAAL